MNSDVDTTLNDRGKRYGEFAEHAALSQHLKAVIHHANNWPLLKPDMKEALDMVMHKVARILNGDPNYADSWHDIAGYVRLVEKRLTLLDG